MAFLTTNKIVNQIEVFKGALKRGGLYIFDSVYETPVTKQLYDSTVEAKEYNQQFWETHEKGHYESRGGLRPAEDFGYKATQEYYLVGPLVDNEDGRKYHLRFENPGGTGEITSFHLTDEGAMTAIHYTIPHSTTQYSMKGRVFFSVEGGRISFDKIGGALGSSSKQMSDARMMSYVPDVAAMMYYFMYKIT